eukprot:2905_1
MDPHAFHEKKPKYEWAKAIESHAVKDVNSSNENEQDDEKMLLEQKSNMHGSTKQFYNFLKQHRLDQFFDKFKENECADIRDIEYLMEDQEFLKNDIGIKSPIHRRRFIGECTKLKEEMDAFKQSNLIPILLLDALSHCGIITMKILCKEVQTKLDLKNKCNIMDEKQRTLLWNVIQLQMQPQINEDGYGDGEG